MIADLLLRPDNRLLGGATGDFSLFGGQPTPGVTFARESASNGHVSIAAPAANDATSNAPGQIAVAAPSHSGSVEEIPAAPDAAGDAFAGHAATSPTAPATPDSSSPALDELVPTALSSGSLVAAGFAALGLANAIPMPPAGASEPAANPLAPSSAGFDAPTLDQLVPQVGTLTATIAPIADAVGGLTDAVGDATAPVVQAVGDDVIDPVAAGVADVVDATDPVLAAVTDTVAPVVTDVAEVVAPVTAGVAAVATPVIDAIDPVTEAIAPVAAAVAPAVAPITDAVQPAGALLQPAAEAVATVTGETMGGSDPEGGVQTLVGMVANADAFDVIAPGTGAAAEPASTVLDDLIGDVTEVAPLLGDHDGANDDGPDLLGGHDGLGLG